jgi:L-threonylcarbamoyladenylate synthase
MTRVLRVDPEAPEPQLIADAARELARGLLVAFPTETVYGLGAHALNVAAVARLFRVKGRPATDPVIVHVSHVDRLVDIATDIPPIVPSLAAAFWPGPLTLVLRKRAEVPDAITAGRPTVAVRVPSHPIARALLDAAVVPIAAPSANRFSGPSPTLAAHVLADLEGAIDVVLDGGPTPIGVESTILDLTVDPPLVRRPGGLSIERIRQLLPETQSSVETLRATAPQPAPGQLQRHYAPRAALTLYIGEAARVGERIANDARAAAASGLRVGILAPREDLLALAPRLAAAAASGRIVTKRYGSRSSPDDAAHDLYAALRDLDADHPDVILAAAIEGEGIGAAVVDRLTRAAEGRVVKT